MPLTTGQILQNRYRIAALLGAGGMGAVYRAWDLRLRKPVALKEMVPQPGLDPETLAKARAQFEQEAIVLGKLKHPNLVPVTDYFAEEGNDYLVMEFVEGESLAARIQRDGALPEADVVAWARQVLDALIYCHARGVIHRDIKPQNIVITPEGTAVLVDFGLVKLWDPADPQTRTVMRGMGTPEYAPPEQWGAPDYHTDPRSDLYSLGATLYHALAGQAPPTASERMAYPKRYRTPRELSVAISERTDAAITHAMALACDDRWPDAATMAAAIAGAPAPTVAAGAQTQAATPLPPTRMGPSQTTVTPSQTTVTPSQTTGPSQTKVMPVPAQTPAPPRRPRVWRWVLAGAGLVALLVVCMVVSVLVREYQRQTAATPAPATPAPTVAATEASDLDQPAAERVLRADREARSRLTSYRTTLNWRTETASGTADLLQMDYAQSQDPGTWQFWGVSDGDPELMIVIGDQMWVGSGDEWMRSETDEAAARDNGLIALLDMSHQWVAALTPDDFDYVGDETVNGIATRHFRTTQAPNWRTLFADDARPEDEDLGAVGDFWIADEPDLPALVVRLLVEVESSISGEPGHLISDQTFTEVNQPITISPPAVGGLFDQLPLYPNAVPTGWSPQAATLEVGGDVTVEEVHTYYADVLSAAGWQLTDDPLVSEELASSTWTLAERKRTVTVGAGETEGSIVAFIVEEPAGQ